MEQFLLLKANNLICAFQASVELLYTSPKVGGHSTGIGVAGWVGSSSITLKNSSVCLSVIGDVLCALFEWVEKQHILLID